MCERVWVLEVFFFSSLFIVLSADRFKATQSAACVLLFKELNRIAKVFGKSRFKRSVASF